MGKIIMSPSKYIQASGAMEKLNDFASGMGSTFLILASDSGMKRTKGIVEESFKGTDKKLVFDVFGKECSKKPCRHIGSGNHTIAFFTCNSCC